MSQSTIPSVRSSPVRDVYRLGDGPEPVLQPGTMGWTASDFEDPDLRWLYEQGRYEIIEGILTVMAPQFFRGGECSQNLIFLFRAHVKALGTPILTSGEVNIQISESRLLVADGVCVLGDDVAKFQALKFPPPRTNWRDHSLMIPPTLVIESISKGHEAHDRKTKRKWYAEFGVRHYWIVDAYSKSLECLLLSNGEFVSECAVAGTDVAQPPSFPGLHIPLVELWGD